MDNKKEVPELSPNSYLSRDYIMALGGVVNYIESIDEDSNSRTRYLAKRTYLHREVPYYEVYFSDEKFNNVITPDNKDSVNKINRLIDLINDDRVNKRCDYEVLSSLVRDIMERIS